MTRCFSQQAASDGAVGPESVMPSAARDERPGMLTVGAHWRRHSAPPQAIVLAPPSIVLSQARVLSLALSGSNGSVLILYFHSSVAFCSTLPQARLISSLPEHKRPIVLNCLTLRIYELVPF